MGQDMDRAGLGCRQNQNGKDGARFGMMKNKGVGYGFKKDRDGQWFGMKKDLGGIGGIKEGKIQEQGSDLRRDGEQFGIKKDLGGVGWD